MNRPRKRILAIDPATKCGWAYTVEQSGVWDLSIKSDESSGMRLIRFESKLLEIHDLLGIDIIAFEIPSVASGVKANINGLKLGTKLQGNIERLAEIHDFEAIGFNLSTVKKHATGKGNANKEAMVAAAKAKWPDTEIIDDNHADALWIWDLANAEFNKHRK